MLSTFRLLPFTTAFQAGLILLLFLNTSPTAHAADCTNIFDSTKAVPAGFGAAYNIFTANKELLIKGSSCESASFSLTVGSSQSQYVYRQGYSWNGNTWAAFTLTGQGGAESWLSGPATTSVSASPRSGVFVVAYVCENINNAWKCGCRDAACTSPAWQLQQVNTSTSTGADTGKSKAAGDGADLSGALVLSSASAWNTPVDTLPVHPDSSAIINASGPTAGVHPDFGSYWNGARNGIPYIVVPENQPIADILCTMYCGEADPGPFPVPDNAPIEGHGLPEGSSSDSHVLVLQQDSSKPNGLGKLYEIFLAKPIGEYPTNVTRWEGYIGAIFDLNKGDLQRPQGWTSADAAGLPIFPGLVRYDEVQRAIALNGENGVVPHAFRFTIAPGYSRNATIAPAQHCAGNNQGKVPFGARFRLRADFKTGADWPVEVKVIINSLKKYGVIMADNGGNWFISGAPNDLWDSDKLANLSNVHGSDFEMVDTGQIKDCAP